MRQLELGSVRDLFGGLLAARYADGLRWVMSLLTSGASGFAGLSAAAIFSLRQFVAGVIDDIPLRMRGRKGHLDAEVALRKNDEHHEEDEFQQPGCEHSAIGKHSDGSFSGEMLWRAGEREREGGLELVPTRGPWDQELRRFRPRFRRRCDGFRNDFYFGHGWTKNVSEGDYY
jgi:hypothetical protein